MVPLNGGSNKSGQQPYILTVVSGKGGVGKTNTSCNLAVMLASYGKRVLLFDADLGLASVDVLFGLVPRFTVQQFLDGACTQEEVLLKGPGGVSILPGCSGSAEAAEPNQERMDGLVSLLQKISGEFDFVIIDAPSGIATVVQKMSELANEVLLVTTPEPTAVMDAYAVAKVLSTSPNAKPMKLLVNMICDLDAGERVSLGFQEVASRFLDRKIETVGEMPFDAHVQVAVRRQQAFCVIYPECPAARCLRIMSLRLLRSGNHSTEPVLQPASAASPRNRIASWLDSRLG